MALLICGQLYVVAACLTLYPTQMIYYHTALTLRSEFVLCLID